jgi:hypothetical protein
MILIKDFQYKNIQDENMCQATFRNYSEMGCKYPLYGTELSFANSERTNILSA